MCGLTGFWDATHPRADALTADVRRMRDTLVHRGPDDAGEWCDAECGIALGFRRLSIVDLSPLGHQPMRSPSGRFVMVFNGEVFNSTALAAELQSAGFSFRGHSDTEVMLAAFEHWGVLEATRRFVGMFAIGLWDTRDRVLHLIRDRLGIKPLFITQRAGRVAFASELKSLMADPAFDRSVDPSALGGYLRFFYVPAPQAIFRNTRKLTPGTMLTIRDPRAELPAEVYWSAVEKQHEGQAHRLIGDDAEMIERVDHELRNAVALRMAHADVPVGAFLSGGIDSSIVVALMQSLANRPVKTYTIAFDEAAFDESAHAAAVARHLGTDHTALRLSPSDGPAAVPLLAEMYDEPFADISEIPTYLVSKLARQDVTVALSGDGGDEVFGGYNRYLWGEVAYHRTRMMPRFMRQMAGKTLLGVSAERWDTLARAMGPLAPKGARLRLFGEKMHKLGLLMSRDSAATFYRSLVAAWDDPERVAPGAKAVSGVFEAVMSSSATPNFFERMMLADLVTYLPDNNLAKVDRASMAVSLEVRVPLLDHRLIELAFRLPPHLKARHGTTKWVLRQVLAKYVPRELFEREKMGFDVPIGAWLRGPLREWAGDLLTGPDATMDGVIDRAALDAVWREHLDGHGNQGLALWAILMLRAWWARWRPTLAS